MANDRTRMQLRNQDDRTVLDFGHMEIWDGADMALIRETLHKLIVLENHPAVGIDMSNIKFIPSGFFGMLYDYREIGIDVRLYCPQPNVRQMLWFEQFFDELDQDSFVLRDEPKEDFSPASPSGWSPLNDWKTESPAEPVETEPSWQ